MATATRAAIEITAADKTGAAFSSLAGKLKGAEGGIATLAAKFAGVQAALAGVLGGAGIAGFVQSTADAIDALNDVADATGATVESLSALEDVARRNGGTLDDVSSILVKFNQALSSADGKNGISKVLQAIGLDAKQLRELDPAEALRKTAVALQGFADDGNKARIVQQLFGKSIKEAAPFLKDLAEAGVLNARVTAEQARQAEIFNKQLAALQTNASNAGRGIVTQLLPSLNEVFVRVEALKREFGGLTVGLAKAFGAKQFTDAADGVIYYTNKLRELETERAKAVKAQPGFSMLTKGGFEKDKAELTKFLNFYRNVYKQVAPDLGQSDPKELARRGKGTAGLPALPDIEGLLKTTTDKATRAFTDYSDEIAQALSKMIDDTDVVKLADLNAKLAKLNELAAAGLDPKIVAQVREMLQPVGSVDEMFPAPSDATIAAYKAAQDVLRNTPTAKLEEQRAVLLQLAAAYERGALGAIGSAEAIQRWSEAVDTALGRIPPEVEKLTTFAEEAARNIQDALGDTLTKLLDGDFKSIGSLWSNLLKKMAAEALAANLNQYLFGKGPTTGEGVLGPIFQAIFGFGKRAAGGPVSAGTPYLVGERGPELIVPRGAGTVIPNHALGGSTVVQNFNVAAGVQRNELMTALQITAQAIKGEVYGTLRMKGVL